MKKIITSLIISTSIISSISFADTITTNIANVPIQLGSSTPQVIGFIENSNTSLSVISSTDSQYKINYNGTEGYISKNYATSTNSTNQQATSASKALSLEIYKYCIESCKAFYRDNNFTYGHSAAIPPSKSTGNTDCSTYVTWVLYEYAKANNNPSLLQRFSKREKADFFYAVGLALKNGSLDEHFVLVNGFENAQLGDILCYNGRHVDFYAGFIKDGFLRAYNCGDEIYIRSKTLITVGSKPSNVSCILRLKELN